MKAKKKSKDLLIEELQSIRKNIADFKKEKLADSDKINKEIDSFTDSSNLEYFLNGAINSIPIPFFIKDEEHRWVILNDAACEYIGYPKEVLVGKTDLDIFPENQAEIYWEHDERVLKTGKTEIYESEILWNNQIRYINTVKSLFIDPITQKKYITGIINDITIQKEVENELQRAKDDMEIRVRERTAELIKLNKSLTEEIMERCRAEEMLNESMERYKRLVELTPEAVVVHREGKVLYINQAGIDLFGMKSFADSIGRNIMDFVHPDYRKLVKERVKNSLQNKAVGFLVEEKMVKADGTIIDVEVTNAPITYFGEAAVLVIIIDITERKKMLEELNKVHKLDSLGVLAGGIAHDFNNLLTSIMGYISVVKSMIPVNEKKYKTLTKAEKASIRAKELTQQLLTFSKGGGPIKTVISLAHLIISCVNIIPKDPDIIIDVSIASDLWYVEVDEGQIFQVINNLLINAKQAIDKKGSITIKAENKFIKKGDHFNIQEGKYVLITVKDTGTGIQEEHLNKIFDPYFSTKVKGDGLGLAIAYSIIKKHEGHINVKSSANKGTTFSIYLPATEKKPKLEKLEKPSILTGEGKILIMDDEDDIREVASDILTELGYQIETAKNGDEAVEKYKKAVQDKKPFDLVLIDLVVPGGMGGEDTIRKLQKINPKVKAVVTSGYSNNEIMSHYKDYGFIGVIAKPYKMLELSKIISRILK